MTPCIDLCAPLATITLRRPQEANKLTPEDLSVLKSHIETVNARNDIQVLLLRSEGKYFCSGFDISEIHNSQIQGRSFGEMVDAVERCHAVTIAVLHAGVYGGATDMALACDFRIGSTATEMFMPAARLGLHFYQSGMERYVSRLGLNMAKRLFLAGERLDSAQMYACGFLTHLVPPQDLHASVTALTDALLTMAPLALLGMKQHLNAIARGQQDTQAIAAAVQRTVLSHDLQEGAAAWRERRKPQFKGQ